MIVTVTKINSGTTSGAKRDASGEFVIGEDGQYVYETGIEYYVNMTGDGVPSLNVVTTDPAAYQVGTSYTLTLEPVQEAQDGVNTDQSSEPAAKPVSK